MLLRLQRREFVGMPDVRAMPSMGKGIFEIRIGTASGAFRVFYVAADDYGLVIFHAFAKKSQKTPQKELDTGLARLKAALSALGE